MDPLNLINSGQDLLGQTALQSPQQMLAAKIGPIDDAFKIKAREKADEFEAVFIAQMFKPMMESIPTDGPLGGGNSEHMFRSLMIDEIGKDVVKRGGVGLSDSIYQEILRMQED